ncbi:MAG: cytidine deaminase [Fimbriimonadales bacterium]|nr:cytidine deaminase [Fimbriimonadales bacterium]
MTLPDTEQELVEAARQARANAYAPYSRYMVGAAVRTADGRIFTGCNIENASYGLSICAERVAVFHAIAAGASAIEAVAVVTVAGATPCGACRQVLIEFVPDPTRCTVIIATPERIVDRFTLAALLPQAFILTPTVPDSP